MIANYNSQPFADSNNPLASPTNMGIPDLFGSSSYGGFNGNCVIGLFQLYFGGNDTSFFDRGVMFSAKSNNFTGVKTTIQIDGSGTP